MCSEEGGEATEDAGRLLPGGAREKERKGVGFGFLKVVTKLAG